MLYNLVLDPFQRICSTIYYVIPWSLPIYYDMCLIGISLNRVDILPWHPDGSIYIPEYDSKKHVYYT